MHGHQGSLASWLAPPKKTDPIVPLMCNKVYPPTLTRRLTSITCAQQQRVLPAMASSDSTASAASSVTIRNATPADLPAIQDLIRASYLAMLDHYPAAMEPMMREGAESAIRSGDLAPAAFEAEYLTGAPEASQFWVAEGAGGVILGCVGLKRVPGHRDEGELVRMSVSSATRGGGLGARLVAHLVAFAEGPGGVLRITLATANPGAASFYTKKCGFIAAKEDTFSMGPLGSGRVLFAVRYLGERVVRRVAIIGGTHGNERIGVELVEQWAKNPAAIARPTLQVFAWPGNPAAIAANVRFVDADLNRQFAAAPAAPASTPASTDAAAAEVARAVALRALFSAHAIDFVIDLHSSNADVGLVAMVPAGEANVTAMRVAAALVSARPERRLLVTGTDLPLPSNWSVDAAAPAGLSFEVGPLPHGTLSSGLLEATRTLVSDTLDALDARNRALLAAAAAASPAVPLRAGGDVVTAAAAPSLVCLPGPRPSLEVFTHVASVPYPEPLAGAAGGSGGGTRWLVHPSLEGPNWRPIADGDAAFISAGGGGETRPFEAPRAVGRGPGAAAAGPQPVTDLHTLFVNEAAYQASNVAFAVYRRTEKTVY